MKATITRKKVYAVPDNVVARAVETEIILIPVEEVGCRGASELYSLNPPAQVIWKKINGKRSLKDIVDVLAAEFSAPRSVLEKDVVDLVRELLKRRLLVEVTV